MKLQTIFAIATTSIAVGSALCNEGLPSGVTNLNVTHTAHTPAGRTFHYHLPAGYDGTKSVQVIFSFHGAGKTWDQQEELSGLSLPYFNPSGVAVYPVAIDNHWLSNPSVSTESPNDIDFTLDVIEWLEENICVDTTRIYATGKSNGGGLTNLLACNATSAAKFAAFAGVSGAYYEDAMALDCAPGKPIPFLSFHGLNDTTIPYDGKNPPASDDGGDAGDSDDCSDEADAADDVHNDSTFPIDQWLKDWAKRNGVLVAGQPVNTTGLFDGLVTRSEWSREGYSDLMVHYKEDDFGHVWPSTYPNPDCEEPSTACPMGHYTFNATTVIVEYFSHWHL